MNDRLEKQAQIQVAYLNALIKKAKDSVAKREQPLQLDAQGYILVNVTLTAEDFPHINDDDLPQQLGVESVTPTVTVSLPVDETQLSSLSKRLDSVLSNQPKLKALTDEDRASLVKQIINKPHRNSDIALLREFHFNLSLASRVYESLSVFDQKGEQIEAAHHAAMTRVNDLVFEAVAKAAVKAKKLSKGQGSTQLLLDRAVFNKELDKARKTLAPKAHQFLAEEIAKHTGVVLSPKTLKEGKKSLKKIAEATTATPNAILHLDEQDLGLATFIEGSDITSHTKNNFAHRAIITHPISNGSVTQNVFLSQHIRTSSIGHNTGNKKDESKIVNQTVPQRLREIAASFTDQKTPFVYNLHTALHDRLGDLGGNLQTLSAKHILLGAHAFNRAQINEDKGNYCLVQNISINRYGTSLGYGGDDLKKETTLMTELALFSTCKDRLLPSQKQTLEQQFENYQKFLQQSAGGYFATSVEGKLVQKELKALRKGINEGSLTPPTTNIERAQNAILKMTAAGLHYQHKYAPLIQELSVFVEKAKASGCKSANERTKSVNGRVDVLISMLNHREKFTNLRQYLSQLGEANPKNIEAQANQFIRELDFNYNNTLQGASSIVSNVDQGASAKIECAGTLSMSRNKAESASLTHLHAKYAGKMQAHKDLTKYMVDAWGVSKTLWERMSANPLGKIGTGIVGVLVFPVTMLAAIGVAIYNNLENKRNVTGRQQGLSAMAQDAPPVRDGDIEIPPSVSPALNKLGRSVSQSGARLSSRPSANSVSSEDESTLTHSNTSSSSSEDNDTDSDDHVLIGGMRQ